MNLSVRQLQTFVEVMRSGSISEAARGLGRTQPAVSSTIAGLEEEIGFPLFERERKRLIPKPEAYYFLEEAEIVLKRLTQARRTIQEIGNLEKGSLKIACNPAASTFFLPSVLAEFLAHKPGVNVSLMMRSSPVVTDWIASQQYDIGFGEALEPRRTIRSQLFSFPCLCAIPNTSELASKTCITPADLDGKPMASIHENHTISIQTRKAFESAGAHFNRRFEFQTYVPALRFVSERLCYVICDSFTAFSHEQNVKGVSGVVFRPFEPTLNLEMSLMSPANRPMSRLAEEFLELLSNKLGRYLKYRG